MEDVVTYSVPFGIMGRILNELVISKKIKSIFDFRTAALKKYLLNGHSSMEQ
jgi:hypothetical protein